MMEYLSSMYIDNELDLDEKKLFLEKIRSDQAFFALTVELLDQEQLLEKQPAMPKPADEKKWPPRVRFSLMGLLKPLGAAAAGFSAAMLLFFSIYPSSQAPLLPNNRFVLFEPGVGQVELAGTFTGWQRVSMKRIGNSGYWELNLPVASGEHRFAYILDNERQIADPTVTDREKDDFGGENSILSVENRI